MEPPHPDPENQPQTFPLEKILNISLREYCWATRIDINNYELVGVHYDGHTNNNADHAQKFSRRVPPNTEVVVEYKFNLAGCSNNFYIAISGLALIPKTHKTPRPYHGNKDNYEDS